MLKVLQQRLEKCLMFNLDSKKEEGLEIILQISAGYWGTPENLQELSRALEDRTF